MRTIQKNEPRLSAYFKLPKEVEFEFLDIYAYRDIPLFLDPYGISAMQTNWSRECETQITTYFQYLIDSIRTGDKRTTARLLNALHEVDEVALGYSKGNPKGRGIGAEQAKDIQRAFETSAAARSGDIKDLADCALMIPGINRDKISDITANILKRQLIKFTQEQCIKHGIPMTTVPVNNAFDYETFTFKSFYEKLPVINGNPKILLPISAVRHAPELSKDKYYRNFVLEFLRAEHEHPGDALASVLKNGRVVVRIADLKKKYPIGSDLIYDFSKKHPEVLKQYKQELRRAAKLSGTSPVLKPKRKILSAEEKIQNLLAIVPGNNDATVFHNTSFTNLIDIFGKRLTNPMREREINEGRKRVDIVFNNGNRSGFFQSLNLLHHIRCQKIFIECKNYGREIGNPEVDQLLGRLSKIRGRFGLLLCRSIDDKANLLKRCRDLVHHAESYIIVLEDTDMIKLLKMKENKQEDEIDAFMEAKLEELIM